MKYRKGTPDQVSDTIPNRHAHAQQPFFPVSSVPASDSQDIGLRDIIVFLHEQFHFGTAQRIKQHPLLQICRNLGIRNDDFRENGMCTAAFLASDAQNAKDNRAMSCFQPPAIIPVTNQAAGVPAASTQSVQRKIGCDFSVNFRCYPLEPFKVSCYHDNAMLSNDFGHCWLCEQEPGFARAGFLLFVICTGSGVRSKTGCHDTMLSVCKRRVNLRAGIHRRVSRWSEELPAYEKAPWILTHSSSFSMRNG